MPKQSHDDYARRPGGTRQALATLASGQNPDGTPFAMPVEGDIGGGGGGSSSGDGLAFLQVRNAAGDAWENVGPGGSGSPVPVAVEASALPTGAATEASLAALLALMTATAPIDVVDRANRALGHVVVDNLPDTQPISGSVGVTNWPEVLGFASVSVDGEVDVGNWPALQQVEVTNWPAGGEPVEVSNWPATQPVSIAATINAAVSGTVGVSNWPATQPVSGTVAVSNLPAVQPISGNVGVNNWPSVQPINDNGSSITVDGTVAVSNFPATQPVSGSVNATVQNWPTTQQTRELKDTARTQLSWYVEALAGATSEPLITLQRSSGFATAAGATSYTVTAAKTLRLHTLIATFVATVTTVNQFRIRIRAVASGTVSNTSPIQFSVRLGLPSVTWSVGESVTLVVPIPEGIELPAGAQFGVTAQATAANGTLDLTLLGYEY